MSEHSGEHFDFSVVDRVGHLSLKRASAFNAMTPGFFGELARLLERLHHDAGARVLVITAEGRHFCAGMDLSVFADPAFAVDEAKAADRTRLTLIIAELQQALTRLEALRMPVIAAIQGACIGGGLDLATACDIRYCSADAFFCVQEINVGMMADLGTLQRLPTLIPLGLARELAYSGRRMGAEEALRAGLVNGVLPDVAALHASVLELAAQIAARAPTAVWGSKQALNYARDHPVEDA
ncbi:MAG: enoyl-CoA hydratase/isomerase family protein, partial [Burkholderiales bacterium]